MDQAADDQRALRAKLMELYEAVKAYFETTNVGPGAGGYVAAFDALRRNQHLAESFAGDLQALMAFIDQTLLPALSAAPKAAPPQRNTGQAAPINDEQTMLLTRMPDNVQQELARFTGKSAPAESKPQARPETRMETRPDSSAADEAKRAESAATPPPQAASSRSSPRPPAPPPAPARPLPGVRSDSASRPGTGPREGAPARPAAPAAADKGVARPVPGGALAARAAAVAPAGPSRPAPAAPADRGSSARPSAGAPSRPASSGTRPGVASAPADKPASAPASAPSRSKPGAPAPAKQAENKPAPARAAPRPAPRPQEPKFDESDVTNPGFTFEPEPAPAKKR